MLLLCWRARKNGVLPSPTRTVPGVCGTELSPAPSLCQHLRYDGPEGLEFVFGLEKVGLGANVSAIKAVLGLGDDGAYSLPASLRTHARRRHLKHCAHVFSALRPVC